MVGIKLQELHRYLISKGVLLNDNTLCASSCVSLDVIPLLKMYIHPRSSNYFRMKALDLSLHLRDSTIGQVSIFPTINITVQIKRRNVTCIFYHRWTQRYCANAIVKETGHLFDGLVTDTYVTFLLHHQCKHFYLSSYYLVIYDQCYYLRSSTS